jgi:hypothetical protein
MIMKKILLVATLCSYVLVACTDSIARGDVNYTRPEKGYAKGRVVDTKGQPIAGARIYVDNTLYDNSGISTTTNADGYYRIQIPRGSWRVYAETSIAYNGKNFDKLVLHPNNPNSFADAEGAIRNFQWKLTGERPKPLAGYYGGLVNLLNNPNGKLYDVENIEFTFTPDGALIDGSTGSIIKAKSGAPGTENYSRINDIPIGRYTVTAKHLPSGRQLKLSCNNGQHNFTPSLSIDFEPALNYCTKCMAIVFSE